LPVIRPEVTNKKRVPTSIERKSKRIRRRHQRGYAMATFVVVAVVALLAYWTIGWGEHRQASIGAGNIPAGQGTTTLATNHGAAGVGATSTSSATSASGSQDSQLNMSAITMVVSLKTKTAECWILVREDNSSGAQLCTGWLSKLGPQTLKGARQYWMNIGEPQNVTISIQGKHYSLTGSGGYFVATAAGVQRIQ